MKRPLLALVCLTVVVGAACLAGCRGGDDQAATQEETAMTPVPLLDRELFFGDPEISQSQLSPDGRWMSFIKPFNGARNIWVKAAEEPFDAARPVTADSRPVPGLLLEPRQPLSALRAGQGRRRELPRVGRRPRRRGARPIAECLCPRPYSGRRRARARSIQCPKMLRGDPCRHERPGPSYHDIYKVDLATGDRVMVRRERRRRGDLDFDLQGELRLAYRPLPGGGAELLRVDLEGLNQIATATYEEEHQPHRLSTRIAGTATFRPTRARGRPGAADAAGCRERRIPARGEGSPERGGFRRSRVQP